MSAGPRDAVIGQDELGRPVRQTVLGQQYGFQAPAPTQSYADQIAALGQPDNRAQGMRLGDTVVANPDREGLGGADAYAAVRGLIEGAAQGITAPARAARGEPVTYGDVAATAMDWGLMGAPMAAPEGALRAGSTRVYRGSQQTPAQEVADLLSSGRAADVTDEMMARADPQEMWRLYESGATGATMPMDESARMARANDMGFGGDWYHGTAADFQQFDQGRANSWMHPPGTYLAGDGPGGSGAVEAGYYAERAGGVDLGNPSIIPVMDRASRGVSYGVSDGGFDSMSKLQSSIVREGRLDWSQGQEIWDGVTGVTGADHYFDPATLSDAGQGSYHKRVVLDPSKIRSRFARFDPRLAHLRNLSAVTVPAGLMLSQYYDERTQ